MIFPPFDLAPSARQGLYSLLNDGNTIGWYQPGVGVTGTLNASAWANQMGAAPSLTAAGAAQPIYLPFASDKYVWNSNVAGNTVTTPTKVVTGDLLFTYDVALDDYTPAADVTLFTKTAANDGFIVKWLTTDKIRLVIGDGVALTNVDVVAASSFADGSRHTVTIAWADGVGATFSYDGVVSGSQVVAAKTLTNAAVALTIGSTTSIGKVYRVQVGSLYDMNPALSAETTTNAATFTGGAGETWTLNNTGALPAQIVGSPSLLFDGTAHFMQATFTSNQPTSIYLVGKQITWASNATIIDGKAGSNALFQQVPTPNVALYAGLTAATNTGWVLQTNAVLTVIFNGASSSITVNGDAPTTGNPGNGNAGGLSVASNAAGAGTLGNLQIKEIIIRNAADSAATQVAIRTKLKQIHGTP